MARPVSTIAGGRVNRRFLALAVVLGLLFAVLVYVWMSQSGEETTSGGGRQTYVVATEYIAPGTLITDNLLDERNLSGSGVGEGALESTELAVGQRAKFEIQPNEPVLASRLVDTSSPTGSSLSYILEDGMRGIAVQVDRVTTAGGLVLPGDHVDILWIPFKGAPTYVLAENVEVTALEQTIVDLVSTAPGLQEEDSDATAQPAAEPGAGDRTRISDAKPLPDAVTATFMLDPAQTLAVLCAEDFASKFEGAIRLAVRSYGDATPIGVNAPACPPPLPTTEGQTQQAQSGQ